MLISENLKEGAVLVTHAADQSRSNLGRSGKGIFIDSIEWAHQIFADIASTQSLELSYLEVSFVDHRNGKVPADDELVYKFLELILSTSVNSMTHLVLGDLKESIYDWLQQNHANNGPLFPHLEEITLKGFVLNSRVLQMFNNTVDVKLYPSSMKLGPSETRDIENIPFNKMKEFYFQPGLDASEPVHSISEQSLNIESNSVEHLRMFSAYSSDDSQNIYVSVDSLEHMGNLKEIEIEAGTKTYSSSDLDNLQCKMNLLEIRIPLNRTAHVRDVNRWVCNAERLNFFEFGLSQLHTNDKETFMKHKHIHCPPKGNAVERHYDVPFAYRDKPKEDKYIMIKRGFVKFAEDGPSKAVVKKGKKGK